MLKMNQQTTIFFIIGERLLSNSIKRFCTGKKTRTFLTFSFSLKGLLTRFCFWKLVRKSNMFSFSLIFKKLTRELGLVFYFSKALIGAILISFNGKGKNSCSKYINRYFHILFDGKKILADAVTVIGTQDSCLDMARI